MSSWKCLFHLGCILLCLPAANAASLQETSWQALYESELQCDALATRNALLRLQEYHRFKLISLTPEQAKRVSRTLAQIVVPAPTVFNGEMSTATDTAMPLPEIKIPTRKRKTRARRAPAGRPVNKERLEAELLKKAKTALRFGRLEESRRFFQLALKLKPDSDEAKAGLEKIAAEMK
jgi:hypothetical protein